MSRDADADTITVTVQPAGFTISMTSGMSVMQSAQAAGTRWPNVCKGQAQCGVCAVEVVAGDLALCPPSIRETQMLGRVTQRPLKGGVMRLACQLVPRSDLTVHKLGVRAPVASTDKD